MFVAGPRRGLLIGLAATCMAALAACSGGSSQPRTLPALSTTPAAVTSTAPPTSKAADLAAVKAVVRRYYALLNAPTTVENADALAALMTADCKCRRVADSTREVAQRGQHYFGRITNLSMTPSLDGDNSADALVQYDYSAGGIRDSVGRVIARTEGRTGTLLSFHFSKRSGRWLISSVSQLRAGVRR